VIIFLNSSKLTQPSPSTSTELIIRRQSLIEHFSPSPLITECSSLAEILPFLSWSYRSNASFNSLLLSPPPPQWKAMNSFKSMNPSPSLSSSDIMRATSPAGVGEPRPLSMAPSSIGEILPSPLLSNFLKILSTSSSRVRVMAAGFLSIDKREERTKLEKMRALFVYSS
ncbi:probable calcium-binding protein cml18, partial [Phtheirospermum japonicum]